MTEHGVVEHMKPMPGWLERLLTGDRRSAERQKSPGLIAYYWDGAAPLAHVVGDISSNGLYLLTEQRWYRGTRVLISLQRVGAPASDPDRTVVVNAKVVRAGPDGVGFAFVLPETVDAPDLRNVMPGGADRKTFQRFLRRLQRNGGQSLVEYALMLPMVLILIMNMVNFAGFFFAWITVSNASRAAGDYAAIAGASVGLPSRATASQITTLITQDMSTLPNSASTSVNICQNTNGTITTLSGTCTSIPADTEPTSYSLMSIDVTYTYVPFIPSSFQFPNLHLYVTLPPLSIHRRTVMRLIQ
jgi:Flp pilus assembly protein TadG